jgi:uncharacterized membrane-anchored protein YitT (DUF2179 family)
MRKKILAFLVLNLGIIITALGLHCFLIPSDLAVGGVTGLAMVINQVLPAIPIGVFMLITNILLFILGFLLVGKAFGAKTIYSSFALSFAISGLEYFFPLSNPITNDLFLNLIVGILIQGIGIGLLFYENASTGGTDIIAKIFNIYFHIPVGKALFATDFLITLFAGLTFGIELGLYALIGILLNAVVIDKVIEGFGLKLQIQIVSDELAEIESFIISDLNRGATLYLAKGAFSKEQRTVLTTILTKQEFIKLKKYLATQKSEAFVSISNIQEVIGNGFSNAV